MIRASAILIDLDGTLVDSIPGLSEAARRMMVELGLPPLPQSEVETYVGKGIAKLVERVLTRKSDGKPDADLFATAMPVYEKHYFDTVAWHCAPYPGVFEGLDRMVERGFRLGCVTNKSGRFADILLDRLGLRPYFPVLVAGDTLPVKKPDPAPLLHAAGLIGVEPGAMVMIGDSANDALAARRAGCPVICVSYGYREGADLRSIDADAIVDSLTEVDGLVQGP
ncbi:MAG: phosphoglycolate phosphatase [Betaproteobacteria bacterium]|jgi:phosphoglycolate phosphatase|nr:phosphoglycolate phosphatase [Betaproteobacteria bacterium]